MAKINIGILKETKSITEKRVPIAPAHIDIIHNQFSYVHICVEPSTSRCFTNEEYEYLGINMKAHTESCDLLIGVKEVQIDKLIPNKTYMFFSHVAKKQSNNRELLRAILQKNITLIDYEYLTQPNGKRIVAFGYWAGIVGAYNALRARGDRTNNFKLKPAHKCHDMEEMFAGLKKILLNPIKILITGGGRAASGALHTFNELNIKKVCPKDFLSKTYNEPVVCQIEPVHYVRRKDNQVFDMNDFAGNPSEYKSIFKPYTEVADMFVACHYWDNESPAFITNDDLDNPKFNISIIADVSCDINGPIASTVKASTIDEPFYGFNPKTKKIDIPFISSDNITVMAVDNLPGELPRNASRNFSSDLIKYVFPSLVGNDDDGIIERATITKNGELMPKFKYLQNYVDGKE